MAEMNTKAMYKLSYGLFVCTAVRGDKMNGCITNTAVQVASESNRIPIAINKANFTHDMIKESGVCNISVISKKASFELFKHFGFQSGRDVDKFAPFICEPAFMTVLSDAPSCTYEYYQSDIKPKPQAVGPTPKGETIWRCRI